MLIVDRVVNSMFNFLRKIHGALLLVKLLYLRTNNFVLKKFFFLKVYYQPIMRNAGLEEAQAGIKIARRNTSNLRYADDNTLMAESEEELQRAT